MSVKKLLVLGAASLAAIGATAAMAGGPDHMAMPAEPAFQNSVYVDLNLGYAQSNWSDFRSSRLLGASGVSLYSPTNHGKGGFSAGADMGYNITRHIAVEGGWYYLPQVKAGVTPFGTAGVSLNDALYNVPAGGTMKLNSWFAYAAAKLSVPVADNVDLFGKVGAAYRSLTNSFSPGTPSYASYFNMAGHGHYWAPLFGTGVQYNWGEWALGAQYMYLPGNDEANHASASFAGAPNAAPEVNLYTAFVGYKFNV